MKTNPHESDFKKPGAQRPVATALKTSIRRKKILSVTDILVSLKEESL